MRTVTNRYVWNSGGPCEEDSDCGGDCIDGKCFQTCEDNLDCTYEEQCLNKICKPKCKHQNECSNFCEKKEDCLSKPRNHAICQNNLCHYIKTGCYSDNHCPEGGLLGWKKLVSSRGKDLKKLCGQV